MSPAVCSNCGKVQDGESGFAICPVCGTPVDLDRKKGTLEEWVGKLLGPHGSPDSEPEATPTPSQPDRTRAGLLAQYRADPEHAALAAYHPAGYVWSFDVEHDRERYFQWRAQPNDSFAGGLPADDRDRRDMLAHEIDASAVPERLSSGWRHFRFCDCATCSPREVECERKLAASAADPAARTREELLADYRADPKHAATEAYHAAGYLWVYDRRREQESWFRFTDERRDRLGQAIEADDVPKLMESAREVEAADVPERGWRYVKKPGKSETTKGVIQAVGDFLEFIDPGF